MNRSKNAHRILTPTMETTFGRMTQHYLGHKLYNGIPVEIKTENVPSAFQKQI